MAIQFPRVGKESYSRKIDGHIFDVELYYSPHQLHHMTQYSLARRLGSRKLPDQSLCLEITPETIMRGIKNQDYTLIGFVKNRNHADSASATLQYFDWCRTGKAQTWIHDLCRTTSDGEKQKLSPVAILFQEFGKIVKKYNIYELYLMVENKEPERTKLPTVYKRYGFVQVPDCVVDAEGTLVLRKQLVGRSRTRKVHRSH